MEKNFEINHEALETHTHPAELAAMDDSGAEAPDAEKVAEAENPSDTLGSFVGLSVATVAIGATILAMPRGGNFKTVRANLVKSGKANAKQPMPKEQKAVRKRKRKK